LGNRKPKKPIGRGDSITGKLKILLKMSLVLTYCGQKPIIRVGRFAGQYAKPRSQPTETRNGVTLPSFRGHLVNRPEFTEEKRRPNPKNLLRAYETDVDPRLNYEQALEMAFLIGNRIK
jgi:3-deoxy-7-phosphoheptulonate synthase